MKDELRILVVDDEWPISESLAMILTRNGFATKSAESGEQAVALAEVFLPDLLISDVIRTNELQVWFLAEHLVNAPVVKAK